MKGYAVLCGASPEGCRQKKLEEKYQELLDCGPDGAGCPLPEENILVFPSGLHELALEDKLNGILDDISDSTDDESGEGCGPCPVLLYFCTLTPADQETELSGSCTAGIPVLRLGTFELRKDVIAYYKGLFEEAGARLSLEYAADSTLISAGIPGLLRSQAREAL